MNNQDVVELSNSILDTLYLFTSFFGGLYIGYLFGRKDERDDSWETGTLDCQHFWTYAILDRLNDQKNELCPHWRYSFSSKKS